MKRILIATVLAIGLMTSGGYANARGNGGGSGYGGHGMMMGGGGYGMMGGGCGMGSGMMEDYGFNKGLYHYPGAAGFGRNGWTSEQNQKFQDDTVELRKEMHDKRFEYMEAVRNPKSTRQQLSMMEKEMIDLRDKIYDKAPIIQEAQQNKPG
ncbi:MAG: hypothetical protein KJ630_21215 [Proteobacteria bacterium]|nr:hypothetical protein [Pseudomonadota bacterium]